MLALKFLCVQHIRFLSLKLHTSFSHLLTLFLSSKNGKSLFSLCNCSRCQTLTLREYPISLSSLEFSMKSLLNKNFFKVYSKPFIGNFCPLIHIVCILIHKI